MTGLLPHRTTLQSMPTTKSKPTDSAATLGYEAQLWQMAEALRGSMDAASRTRRPSS